MKNRLWIVPRNDLEATEIIRLLEQAGETVLVSLQQWGATWEKLEDDIVTKVGGLLAQNPETEVVGVELGGPTRWNGRNVDHHAREGEAGGKFELASIELIADELGIELNRYLRLVAANDKAYIPGMLALGADRGEIDLVRTAERSGQGIDPDQEAEAVRAINAPVEMIGETRIIRMAHSKTATVTDRLFDANRPQRLLILAGDGEANYFGDGAVCAALKERFEGWGGGSGFGTAGEIGYWGGYPKQDEIVGWFKNREV